jgi:hypothetical protein
MVFEGSSLVIGRVSATVKAPAHWSTTLYCDNINNNNRSPLPEFPGINEWSERVRPRTYGLQFEYHLK